MASSDGVRRPGLFAAIALLLAPLAGCEHPLVARNMGNAVRENMNDQVADPQRAQANEPGPTGLDAASAEDVMSRYHRAQSAPSGTSRENLVPGVR